jgi:glycosyltransferase involved in cell wall biosynthesis
LAGTKETSSGPKAGADPDRPSRTLLASLGDHSNGLESHVPSWTQARVAFVLDWITTYSGAERVVEQMLHIVPHAHIFAVVDFLPDDERQFLGGRPVETTFVQRLPWARSKYRAYLPVMPLAVESIDLTGYDLVISSSHAIAKGVLTGPDQLHICMCYSPMRYAWDLQHQYLEEAGLLHGPRSWLARALLHWMRIWDGRTANGVDEFIAISRFIARRIEKVYRRPSTVIYPPVDTQYFVPGSDREDFYLTVSRLVPYKRVALIANAFRSLPDRRLLIVGDGPEMSRIRALAGPNVKLLGRQPTAVIRELMQRARGFVYAAEEDFGIVVVEAQACGTPAIVFRGGAAAETVRGWTPGGPSIDCPTGVFFDRQAPDDIAGAIRSFEDEAPPCSAEACRAHAEAFAIERFRSSFAEFVDRSWRSFKRPLNNG